MQYQSKVRIQVKTGTALEDVNQQFSQNQGLNPIINPRYDLKMDFEELKQVRLESKMCGITRKSFLGKFVFIFVQQLSWVFI